MRKDQARQETDKKLSKMERQLEKIYKDAKSDITEKWNAYMERGEKRLSSLSEKYGTDSQKYKDALRNYTLKNAWYKDMVDATTARLANVNQTALSYIQDQMPEIYALNYNQFGVELEKTGINSEGGIRFNLVDEATVKRMIRDGDIEMPNKDKRLSIPKDQRWNTKQINSSVLQGIIQGETINQISKRLEPIMDNNSKAAIRNARTLVTGAECRGRLDSYRAAEDDGIVLNKVWMATPDGRTRDWHVDMDGQEVGVDEEFTDGLGNTLMYPGDPGGAPETVYNCRCTTTTHIIGFRRPDGTISEVDYNPAENMHERQIGEERARRMITGWGSKKDRKMWPKMREMKKTKSGIRKVSNRQEAYEALQTMFSFVEKNVNVIDEKLLVENVNRLLELNEKFKVLTQKNIGYITSSKSGKAIAWTSTRIAPNRNGKVEQNINMGLVGMYYKDGAYLYDTEKLSAEIFYTMPCKENNYNVYSLCHEYGHMLESKITIERTDYDKIQSEIEKKVNPSHGQISGMYRKAEEEIAKTIYREILQIAKDKNKDFQLKENLSKYGRSNYFEAFAEIFANSQCGSPNELGNAMNEWLKKEGY